MSDDTQRIALVTGGAGFIGSHLVDALLAGGSPVRVLDNLSTGSIDNLEHCRDRIELIEGDIRDLDTCRTACDGVGLVYHQAALGSVPRSLEDPATTYAVNALGTANIFTAARDSGVRRVVYASSSSVYGDSPELPKCEGGEGRPLSPYALSKKICEELADQYNRDFGLEIAGLRYFNVFGPRQSPDGPYAAVVPRFFGAALAGRGMIIHGDGEQSRDFTAVADAVSANLLAGSARSIDSRAGYNVAAGRRTTINALAGAIAALCGSDVAARHDPPRAGDVRHSLADLSRATTEIGYRPTTTLEDGLGRCLDYYRHLFTASREDQS